MIYLQSCQNKCKVISQLFVRRTHASMEHLFVSARKCRHGMVQSIPLLCFIYFFEELSAPFKISNQLAQGPGQEGNSSGVLTLPLLPCVVMRRIQGKHT